MSSLSEGWCCSVAQLMTLKLRVLENYDLLFGVAEASGGQGLHQLCACSQGAVRWPTTYNCVQDSKIEGQAKRLRFCFARDRHADKSQLSDAAANALEVNCVCKQIVAVSMLPTTLMNAS